MTSFVTWIDHDPEAKERMTRILALFSEKESRDELGLGAIREALSDLLFPGTSTIQTRLRYMLFIPWVYQQLEEARVSALDVARRARKDEIGLVAPLLHDDPTATGVLGSQAKGALKRLPSSVYWAGLGAWRILRFRGSQDEYHRAFERFSKRERYRRADDGDLQEPADVAWDPQLPPLPEDWPTVASLALTRVEAEYIRDRLVQTHERSLLAWLANDKLHDRCDFPWTHPAWARFQPEHRRLLLHAHMLSEVMLGAALLYNRDLARLKGLKDLEDDHQRRLADWVVGLRGLTIMDDWNLDELWALAGSTSHQISSSARDFVRAWLSLARTRDLSAVTSEQASALVERRERSLKKTQSRYVNERARDQWSGYAGTYRANYRWPTVQRFMADLHAGLEAS